MTNKKDRPEGTNRLYYATSPYLKQHAGNPVDWYPWGKEALEKARREDKPILVSIGYSSCHWCHVMERESFENDSVAELMNKYFVNIKVDREERPDIDQIYMEAVQAMGMQGGWPLNVFLTPDQKPFYGGTYFPPKNWVTLLQNINKAYQEKRTEIDNSADDLAEALSASELLKYKLKAGDVSYRRETLDGFYYKLENNFDTARGGFNRAPKFPMPVNWKFLLQYAHLTGNGEALRQVNNTLTAMAYGGIYDQVGGGFARYSTDANWLVPHFEKMLYDNGQLLALYSEAYKITENPLYKQVAYETVQWLTREMTSKAGGFYSALDADSEGVEGKFYVWDQAEIEEILGADASLFGEYYQVDKDGNWEGHTILHRKESIEEFAAQKNVSADKLRETFEKARMRLLEAREERVRPGLDDKVLAGWNGLMLEGLVKAYEAFSDPEFLELAVSNATYIRDSLIVDGKLMRLAPTAHQQIDGYLEDYAFVISAFISLYQATFNTEWLLTAEGLARYAIEHFLDKEEDMFFFTGTTELIARKKEIFDNVIPASNSQMAINLYFLGTLLDQGEFSDLSGRMLGRMQPMISSEPAYLSNWAVLYMLNALPTAEIAIIGPEADGFRSEVARKFLPNRLLMGGTTGAEQPPLLRGKSTVNDKTTIYVCYNRTCRLPVNSVEEAFAQLK